jgi:hypothetical protein
MDAGIADTINRRDAHRIALRLDAVDYETYLNYFSTAPIVPWFRSPMADTMLGENASTNADRAWLVGVFAAGTAHISFDGAPADGDWENLFSCLRAEILARRDPQTSPVHANESVRDGVGSR